MIFVFDTVENSVEKGENAGYQYFLLPNVFKIASLLWLLKLGDLW